MSQTVEQLAALEASIQAEIAQKQAILLLIQDGIEEGKQPGSGETSPLPELTPPATQSDPPPVIISEPPKAEPPIVADPVPPVIVPPVVVDPPVVVTPPPIHINLPALPSDVPTVFVAEIIPGYSTCTVHVQPDPSGKVGCYLWVPVIKGVPQWNRVRSSGTAQLHGPFSNPIYNKSNGQWEFKEVRYPGLEVPGVTDGEQGVLLALDGLAPGTNAYAELPPKDADEDDCLVFVIREPLTEALRGRITNGHGKPSDPMPVVLGISTLVTLHATGVTGTKSLVYFEGFDTAPKIWSAPILPGTNPDDPQGVARFLSDNMEFTAYRMSDTLDKLQIRFKDGQSIAVFEDGGNVSWTDPKTGKVTPRVGGTLYSGFGWKPIIPGQEFLVDLSNGQIWCFRVRYPAKSDGRRWWHQKFYPYTSVIRNNAFHNRNNSDATFSPVCPFSGGLGLTWAQLPEFHQIVHFWDPANSWNNDTYNGLTTKVNAKTSLAGINRSHPRAYAIDQKGHESWSNEMDCGYDYGHSMRMILSQERCQIFEQEVKRADIWFDHPLAFDKIVWQVFSNLYHSAEEARTVAPWDPNKPGETHSIEPEYNIRNVEIGYMRAPVDDFAVRRMTAFAA